MKTSIKKRIEEILSNPDFVVTYAGFLTGLSMAVQGMVVIGYALKANDWVDPGELLSFYIPSYYGDAFLGVGSIVAGAYMAAFSTWYWYHRKHNNTISNENSGTEEWEE